MQKFQLSIGPSSTAKNKDYTQKDFTFEDLEALFAYHDPRKHKDGQCFVPGPLLGDRRIKTAVPKISCLVYDIDGAATFEEIDTKLDTLGYKALLYSTFSHKVTRTNVKTDAYVNWCKKANENARPTVETITRYFEALGKGHLKNIKCDGIVKHEPEGLFYHVDHDPVDKMRIIFPLEKPIIISELSDLTAEAIHAYKEIYHGVGNALDLPFDRACDDLSRLHYMPSHPRDTKNKILNVKYIDGVKDGKAYEFSLLDYTQFERTPIARKGGAGNVERKESSLDWIVYDAANNYIDLKRWDETYYDSFDIEAMLRRVLPEERIRDDRASGDGFHIECPFEAEHTQPGGQGTFVVNGNKADKKGWVIYCSHNSCNTAERRKLHYLKEMIREGFITAQDLGLNVKETKAAPTPQNIENKQAEEAGIDPATLPSFNQDEFTDTVEETKIFTDKNIAQEAARKTISEAQYGSQLSTGFNYLRQADIKLDDDKLVELITFSQVPVNSIISFVHANKADFGISSREFGEEVRARREHHYPLAQALGSVIHKNHASMGLELEQKRLAAYYGVAEKLVKAQFKSMQRTQDLLIHDEDLLAHFDDLEKQYALLWIKSKVHYLDMIETEKTGNGEPIYYRPGDLTHSLLNFNHTIEVNKDKGLYKQVNVWTQFLSQCKTKQMYRECTFDPGRKKGEQMNGSAYNLWTGFRMKPKEGDASPITKHILEIWCGGDVKVYNWLTMYLKDIVTRPEVKPQAAIVIQGGSGTGKSLVIEHGIGRMVDPWYLATGQSTDLVGKFNANTANKLVVLSEEAIFAGSKRDYGTLKHLVSGLTHRIERKGVDAITVPSYTRYFFISNEVHAIHMDPDDRRFLVLETSDEFKQDVYHFGPLIDWLKADGAAIWLNYLYNFKPEDHGLDPKYDLLRPPWTMAKQAQIELSNDAPTNFFLQLLKFGRLVSVPNSQDMPYKLHWPLDESYEPDYHMFQQCYDAYIRYMAPGSIKFDSCKSGPVFKRCMGKSMTSLRAYRTDNITKRRHTVLSLPARREMIEEAIKRRFLSNDDLQAAIDNKDSHMPQFTED